MQSRSGAEFRIFISIPKGTPGADGYPVIYLLDANAMFATVVDAVSLQSRRPTATGVEPAVIVGLGYPTDLPIDAERRTYDYTPAVPTSLLSTRPDDSSWPKTGGADHLLEFFERDLKPIIARDFPIDSQRQTLFGHSFGGLFTLYAMFTRPDMFSTFVAGSPSIWFADRSILTAEKAFSERLRATPRCVRLLMGVGALEQSISENEGTNPQIKKRMDWVSKNRMIDNAVEMAARLHELAPHGLQVTYCQFEGENHVSVIPALISRALRFAMATRDDNREK